jgi:probable HAF family extracellular repeat protein
MSAMSRRIPLLGSVAVALATWGCSSDESPTGPSAAPEQSATAAAATYTVRNLGHLGGGTAAAFGINNAGVVVGHSSLASGSVHAFRSQNGVMKDLGTIAGGTGSQANAINNGGVIVGWSFNSAGDMRAVRWAADGKKRSLGTLGGRNSEARAINEFGVIVGWSEIATGQRHAFRWQNGVMTDLGTLGGLISVANGINRGGAIVGSSTTASGKEHAFKWKDGVFKDLGDLGREYSVAVAINTKGQIVGLLGPRPDGSGEELDDTDGFLFYQDAMVVCCTLGGGYYTDHVENINPNGVVVGWGEDLRAEPPYPSSIAWVQDRGAAQSLPTLAPGDLSEAKGINLAGNIVGSSDGRAVLWTRH